MKALIYQSVNLEKWKKLASVLEHIFCLTIKTHNGSSSQWGFGFEWYYDVLTQDLSLKCIKKPSWIPEALFESHVETLITNILSSE